MEDKNGIIKAYEEIFPIRFARNVARIVGDYEGLTIPLDYIYFQKLEQKCNLSSIEQICSRLQPQPTLAQVQIGGEFYKIVNLVAKRNKLDLIDLKLKTIPDGVNFISSEDLFGLNSSIQSLSIGKFKFNDLEKELLKLKNSILEIEDRFDYKK